MSGVTRAGRERGLRTRLTTSLLGSVAARSPESRVGEAPTVAARGKTSGLRLFRGSERLGSAAAPPPTLGRVLAGPLEERMGAGVGLQPPIGPSL